tara:strand:+ start:198 stop:509 length:312 start_codon:yes stop_codon:yes gene_type:complete
MGIDFMRADSTRELCAPAKLARAFSSLPITNFTGLMRRSLLEVMQHEECRQFAPLKPWVAREMDLVARKIASASASAVPQSGHSGPLGVSHSWPPRPHSSYGI